MNFLNTVLLSITYRLSHISHPIPYASRLPYYLLRIVSLSIICLLIALILLPRPLAAQSPPDANVEFFISRSETEQPITVGDQIKLRLEITHPIDSRVVLPQVEEQWPAFEVIDQTPPATVDNGDGTATTGREIIVALFQPGQYQTPSLVVVHRKSDGSLEELATPVIPIHVTSVLSDELELRDLKPQAELPVPPLWPWILASTILTILLIGLLFGAGLWLYHRYRTRLVPQLAPVPFVDTRPPEVIAHAELDRIEALNLPAQNRIKEHYILVTVCMRRYIEGRYKIPALEQTTGELRVAFKKSSMSVRDMSGFMSLLSESDLVKFARYRPYIDEVNRLINKARAVVDATTPRPEIAVIPSAPEPEPEVVT